MFRIFKKKQEIVKVPNHIGLIMDGNSRWAKKRLIDRKFGHKKGADRVSEIIDSAKKINIESLTFYAFSTENWKRENSEIDYLFNLIMEFERKFTSKRHEGTKIKFIGSRIELPQNVLDSMDRMEDHSKNANKITVYIAINYGGQDEIVRATKRLVENNIEITKENIASNLDTDYDSLDLLIRTSGEKRISNFLIWQNAYSEFVFTDCLWPDFNENEFYKCIEEYNNKSRRFGGR